jgi:hypothetical protein
MVNISNIDVRTIPYFKDKTDKEISAAAAVQQPSHPEMLTVVTNFLDALINSGTETAAGNNSNTEAQKAEAQKIVQEVAGDLAKHVFIVKELLINDRLAKKQEGGQGLAFIANTASGTGSYVARESIGELAKQALESVKTNLHSYGIEIDTSKATKLQEVIIQKLQNPPKPKSEVDITASAAAEAASTAATTENTPPENPNISIIDFLKEKHSELTKGLLGCRSIVTFLNQPADSKTGQASGISQLRELNKKIEKEIDGWNNLDLDKAGPALKSFRDNLTENAKFIADHLGKGTFISEFPTLDENKKIQVGILLKSLETTVDEKIMVGLTGKITGQLGNGVKQSLQTKLSSLIDDNSNTPNTLFTLNLSKANEHLEKYNQALKDIKSKNLSTQQEIQEKQKATNEFSEDIKRDLENKTLSIEDVKVIQKSLELTEEERKSGKASPAIDNIFGNFINSMKEKAKEQGIEITEEGLKQFAGIGVALAIGTTLFCPKLLGGLVQSAFSLGTMLTRTIIPIYNNMTQRNSLTRENL